MSCEVCALVGRCCQCAGDGCDHCGVLVAGTELELLRKIRGIVIRTEASRTALAALGGFADIRDLLFPESEAAKIRAVEMAKKAAGKPWKGV